MPRINKKIGKMRLYCIRLSDKLLILGNGAVTTSQSYEEDPCLSTIMKQLRKIERQIEAAARQSKTDYEDFDAVKSIIENISIQNK